MYIRKVIIKNYKCFYGSFELELNKGMNIIVGPNEAGKSTILEAINLALSGIIHGKYLQYELTQFLFNNRAVCEYLASLKSEQPLDPPEILIELFFEIEDESLAARFEGTGNSLREKASGVQFRVKFNDRYQEHYSIMLGSNDDINSLPIEFYDYYWSTFARNTDITPRQIPIKAAFIDSSNNRLRSGSDVYISKMIHDYLTDEQKIQISQSYRKLKENFIADAPIDRINNLLEQEKLSNKKIELSVDMSTRDAWESSITTYLDEIPFSNIGRGEQCLIKTKLALRHRKALEASLLLLEEPENHLSYGKLNELLRYIEENSCGKQVIVSTHSSFVANKLGLENLILINVCNDTGERRKTRFGDLKEDTCRFFAKLAGYDTLRLILCDRPILVEGPSDELIVQKAYMKYHNGRLPIQDNIDVISVGTSFLRFLEIAQKLEKHVVIVTDNDRKYNEIQEKYSSINNITLCVSKDEKAYTLELQVARANRRNLGHLRSILGIPTDKYQDESAIAEYMIKNKVESAWKIFESDIDIEFPQYILKAVGVGNGNGEE